MAGGKGERFWPMSRIRTPKQTLRLMSRYSLIRETVSRIKSIVPYERIYVVTNKEQLNSIRPELPNVKNIIAEPIAKNTATACGLAAMIIKERDPNATMIVLPSDHFIRDKKRFIDAIQTGIKVVQASNALVAIGVKPSFPATGYGYLKIDTSGQFKIKGPELKARVHRIKEFVEKPGLKTAVKFLKQRKYYWNSGIFIWKASSILDAIKEHLPRLYLGLQLVEPSIGRKNFYDSLKSIYPKFESISIDYGVLEKEKRIFAIEGKFYWDDLGSWDSLARHLKTDINGNFSLGMHKGVDTTDSVVVSEKGVIGTVGVSGIIVVRHGDCVLVCSRERAQDVKSLVSVMRGDERLKKWL
ncbi:MAG: sugar phosphate nucleotidyltransferase [Candidatus Omnitrophota bacterium]